jgi:recombination protein RecR
LEAWRALDLRGGGSVSVAVPKPVERLIEAFARLPGIGHKTASRLTYYLLRSSAEDSQELATALQTLHEGTGFCPLCFNIMAAGSEPCAVCRDERRDGSLLCVVEDPLDVVAFERTGQYEGLYHVLHGAISPVEGVGPEDLRIEELIERIGKGGIEEVILATNPTLEGEATAMFLKRRLEGMSARLTRLARGLPSGGDVEYADASTLADALSGRREV